MIATETEVLRALAARLLEVLARYQKDLAGAVEPLSAPGELPAEPLRPLGRAWVEFMRSHLDLLVPGTLEQHERQERLARLEVHFTLLLELEARCLEITTGRRPPD